MDIVQSSDQMQSYKFVLQDPEETSDICAHLATVVTCTQSVPTTALAIPSTVGKVRNHSGSVLCMYLKSCFTASEEPSGNLRAAHCTPETDSTHGGNLLLQSTAQFMTQKSVMVLANALGCEQHSS